MFSTSSPTYPASVSAVASAIANGHVEHLRQRLAQVRLAAAGGPMSRMFDFAISTGSSCRRPGSPAWMRL
jgi:hypothetical protein